MISTFAAHQYSLKLQVPPTLTAKSLLRVHMLSVGTFALEEKA